MAVNYCQLLSMTVNYCQLLSMTVNDCQLLSNTVNDCVPVCVSGRSLARPHAHSVAASVQGTGGSAAGGRKKHTSAEGRQHGERAGRGRRPFQSQSNRCPIAVQSLHFGPQVAGGRMRDWERGEVPECETGRGCEVSGTSCKSPPARRPRV